MHYLSHNMAGSRLLQSSCPAHQIAICGDPSDINVGAGALDGPAVQCNDFASDIGEYELHSAGASRAPPPTADVICPTN